jgi:uncharacterized membrane protein
MTPRQRRILRAAFIAGAIADGLALVPMLVPRVAHDLWGLDGANGAYWFAMGYGATLMAGWTALLIWAARRPVERRFVAALTAIAIHGLVATEIVAVAFGVVPVSRMIPTWALQAGLFALFAIGYHGVPGSRRALTSA